ncbi:hypothetical protein MN608_03880 [Microdochium nivale]|nr:hypothetical protein MN608_03880 [Microdochium nivale]
MMYQRPSVDHHPGETTSGSASYSSQQEGAGDHSKSGRVDDEVNVIGRNQIDSSETRPFRVETPTSYTASRPRTTEYDIQYIDHHHHHHLYENASSSAEGLLVEGNIFDDSVDDDRSVFEHQAETNAEYELAHAESYTSDDEFSSQYFSPTEDYEYVGDSDDEVAAAPATAQPKRSRIRDRLGSLQGSNNSSGEFYPPSSLSLIGHTGHSSEAFPINMDRLRERLGGRFRSRGPHAPAR